MLLYVDEIMREQFGGFALRLQFSEYTENL
jgi:hypothetical protein